MVGLGVGDGGAVAPDLVEAALLDLEEVEGQAALSDVVQAQVARQALSDLLRSDFAPSNGRGIMRSRGVIDVRERLYD